ncbi:hypothetical protein AIGOOFII_0304 [Methylobacterium marchantiae]|nr:hypothetical protein AIGOOFII_0304 [Methylobacterium marchantiae]
MYQTTAWPAVRPSSASRAHLALRHWPKASESGAFEPVPSSFIFLKAGLSCICRRIQTETPSSTIETRNGMRQPQAAKGVIVPAEPSASVVATEA